LSSLHRAFLNFLITFPKTYLKLYYFLTLNRDNHVYSLSVIIENCFYKNWRSPVTTLLFPSRHSTFSSQGRYKKIVKIKICFGKCYHVKYRLQDVYNGCHNLCKYFALQGLRYNQDSTKTHKTVIHWHHIRDQNTGGGVTSYLKVYTDVHGGMGRFFFSLQIDNWVVNFPLAVTWHFNISMGGDLKLWFINSLYFYKHKQILHSQVARLF
jgi:hypothetical protein